MHAYVEDGDEVDVVDEVWMRRRGGSWGEGMSGEGRSAEKGKGEEREWFWLCRYE